MTKNFVQLFSRPCAVSARLWGPLLLAALFAACAPKSISLPTPESGPPQPGVGTLKAGHARLDITPPPGYGLFGYGPEAKRAVGYRNRLYVRSLVLEDANGEVVAFALADLDMVSTLLHRLVAEKLLEATDSAIGADRLILSATHTHSAPGHYLSGWPLNEFGSSIGGFDAEFAEWLADKIAKTVVSAYEARRPARAGWAVTDVWGHTRNRSLDAYRLNSGTPLRVAAAPAWLPEAQRAVNPRWAMLRVDEQDSDGRFVPAAAFSIFAIHGTGFPSGNDLYEADIHGLVARGLERHIEPGGLHLFANGAEGDVSPNWPPDSRCDPANLKPVRRLRGPRTPRAKDDWQEPPASNIAACLAAAKTYVRAVGSTLADTAIRIFDDLGPRLRSDLKIERAFETLMLVGDSARSMGLCDKAEAGAASAAGAADGRTRFAGWRVFGLFSLGIEAGGQAIKTTRTDCQRPKRALFGKIQQRLVGQRDFPAYTQLAVVRVGDMMIGTVPGEATTMVGLRMLAAMQLARSAGVPADHYAVLGLTNGDLRYITTREEYWAQLYEGGSNLYGPRSAEVLASRLGRLAASLPSSGSPAPVVRVDEITVKPGDPVSYWPRKGPRPDDLEFERPPACVDDAVLVRWFDAPPGSLVPADGSIIAFERQGDGARVIDDDIDVEVRAIGKDKSGYLWEARWTPAGGVAAGDQFSVTLPRWSDSPAASFGC